MGFPDISASQLCALVSDLSGHEDRVHALLPVTVALLRAKVRKVEDKDPELVSYALAQAIARRVRYESANIGPYRSESDNGYGYTVDNRVASADLWWPESELEPLGGGSKKPTRKPGTIPLAVPYSYPPRTVQW